MARLMQSLLLICGADYHQWVGFQNYSKCSIWSMYGYPW